MIIWGYTNFTTQTTGFAMVLVKFVHKEIPSNLMDFDNAHIGFLWTFISTIWTLQKKNTIVNTKSWTCSTSFNTWEFIDGT
jgi:hypothetical protein